jgi:hypothetical protein
MKTIHMFVAAFAAGLLICPMLFADEAACGWTASPSVIESLSKRIPTANFVEAEVPEYTLPDPLAAADGSRVTRQSWPRRRAEILEMFRHEVYGRAPIDRPENMSFTVIEKDPHALGDKATRKLVEIAFDTPHAGRYRFRIALDTPNGAPRPVPTLVLLNFAGFGCPATPLVIDRGFGLAVMDRTQLAADDTATFRDGAINAFSGPGPLADDAWKAIAAWAWGASRVMDYLQTDPDVDAHRVAVTGFSRMAKTALWAGASDERFAAVLPNESGCGGAAISRRRFGETVGRINTAFPHWFCQNFQHYNNNEEALPVDQHMLVALVAPRPIYITSADEDLWSDPRGELLGCLGADPVYRLLGVAGLATDHMPPLQQPVISGRIGYDIRRGPHAFREYDWQQFLDFMNLHLPGESAAAAP